MCVRKTYAQVRNSCTSTCPNFGRCQIRLAAMEAVLSGTEDQPSLGISNPAPVVSSAPRAILTLVSA